MVTSRPAICRDRSSKAQPVSPGSVPLVDGGIAARVEAAAVGPNEDVPLDFDEGRPLEPAPVGSAGSSGVDHDGFLASVAAGLVLKLDVAFIRVDREEALAEPELG